MVGATNVLLAGTLEKRGRWRKEWNYRFCVVRRTSIDYFLTAPALVDDENEEGRRGSILLRGEAAAAEEPGRPFCISVGGELLSCGSRAEQQRWLETLGVAALAAAGGEPSPLSARTALQAGPQEPPLLLLPPEEPLRRLRWREPSAVVLAGPHSTPSVLILDGGGGSASSGSATALCRLPLYDAPAGDPAFPLQTLTAEPTGLKVCVRVHRNELVTAAAKGHPEALMRVTAWANPCLGLALAFLVAGITSACGTAMLLAMLLLLLERVWMAPALAAGSQQRRVTFSVEQLSTAAAIACGLPPPESAPNGAGDGAPTPLWVGRWKLDKSRSELYEPVLADMGVNYLLRKAADAKTSILTITTSATHLTINLKTWVVVEDRMPLDGSWQTKAVPPGSRMRGNCRVRLTRSSASELEMLTEFPEGWGELRDTLTVAADGSSFTRRVARNDSLAITRFFLREA